MQDLGFCSPTGTSCSLNLTASPSNCSVSCDGFYGDISHIKDNDQNIKKLEPLHREYGRYKDRDVKNTLETQISVIRGTMGLLTGRTHISFHFSSGLFQGSP